MTDKTTQRWWMAGDVEYGIRAWILAAMFFAAFQMYWWDHVPVAAALAAVLTRGGGNLQTAQTMILAMGAAATLAAAALRTWAAAYMRSIVVHDPRVHDSRLVADGPYRHLRNPLYLGTILMAFGVGLAASRSGFVLLVLAITLFQYRLTLREERALKATQGESYDRYLAVVPRIVPSLKPCVPESGIRPQWGQAIRGELFMWGFALTFALFTATGSTRVLMYGCIVATALVLLMRSWGARGTAKEAGQ
ncbi:MAG TPA: isoprenylcysteine carboxylmethyltransferase family protein [Acidobacteriaceae bacterium]